MPHYIFKLLPFLLGLLLNQLCLVDCTTLSLWTGQLRIKGVSGNFYYYHVL